MTNDNLQNEGLEADTQSGGGDRCFVIHPDVKSKNFENRAVKSRLEEICGLAEAIDLNIVVNDIVTVSSVKPGSFFGKGTMERLGTVMKAHNVNVVIIDTQLSPVQQRNLERSWDCKVLDRTGIILEIFGERARTKEGCLQVELAHLTYQRSRLVRSWTHLERQRGGAGFMGGPGETQIEVDRRLIDQRLSKLKRQLKDVKRTRELHRTARRKVPYPIVALVGYTNAGKSTLFNRLTNADVFVKDQLFATLDPTMRALKLPNGRDIILSDTVGFISDLPHELVESFHATLEEVLEAEVVVHVRDIAHMDSECQSVDVATVLNELGIDDKALQNTLIEVRNKVDLLSPDDTSLNEKQAVRADHPIVLTSAVKGSGLDDFLAAVEHRLSQSSKIVNIDIPVSDGKKLSWFYAHGEVLKRVDDTDTIHLEVRFEDANYQRYLQL